MVRTCEKNWRRMEEGRVTGTRSRRWPRTRWRMKQVKFENKRIKLETFTETGNRVFCNRKKDIISNYKKIVRLFVTGLSDNFFKWQKTRFIVFPSGNHFWSCWLNSSVLLGKLILKGMQYRLTRGKTSQMSLAIRIQYSQSRSVTAMSRFQTLIKGIRPLPVVYQQANFNK